MPDTTTTPETDEITKLKAERDTLRIELDKVHFRCRDLELAMKRMQVDQRDEINALHQQFGVRLNRGA